MIRRIPVTPRLAASTIEWMQQLNSSVSGLYYTERMLARGVRDALKDVTDTPSGETRQRLEDAVYAALGRLSDERHYDLLACIVVGYRPGLDRALERRFRGIARATAEQRHEEGSSAPYLSNISGLARATSRMVMAEYISPGCRPKDLREVGDMYLHPSGGWEASHRLAELATLDTLLQRATDAGWLTEATAVPRIERIMGIR